MPREQRTPEEKLVDSALLLALLGQVEVTPDCPYVGERLKVMKLAFLATHRMFEARDKGFNFTFYRWKFGPVSNHVYESWDALKGASLLKEEEEFSLTRRGARLVEAFRKDVLSAGENKPFGEAVAAIARKFGSWNHDDLMRHVYDMKVTPVSGNRQVRIADLPERAHITEALTSAEATRELQVEPGWLETLAIALNRASIQSLEEAADDFACGRLATA
jgi:hypothetical protein